MKNAIKKTVSILRLLFGAIILGLAYNVFLIPYKIATRVAYGEALTAMGEDERIIVLDSDLSKSTMTDMFRKKYPERHFNMGIAEGNMMSVAAGLATCGKVVFASSFAIFAAVFFKARISFCSINTTLSIKMQNAQ